LTTIRRDTSPSDAVATAANAGFVPGPMNVWRVSRDDLIRFLLAVAAANVLLMLATYFAGSVSGHWRLQFVVHQATLLWENNLGAWYSSMLLLSVAIAMVAAFVADRQELARGNRSRGAAGALPFGWLVLAFVFAGLSWDEMGSFHERLYEIPAAAFFLRPVPNLNAWVAVLAVPIAVVAVSMLAFGWWHVRRSAKAFGLMCAGILLFASVPVQEHFEAALRIASGAPESYIRPPLHGMIEEGTEVFGSLAFLAAALVYVRQRAAALPGRGVRVDLGPRPLLAGLALMGAALMFVYFHIPHLMYLGDHRGVPQNWPPSAAAALVVALCALMFSWRRQPSIRPLVIGLASMAFLHAMLSLGHATDHVWFHRWFRGAHPLTAAARDLVSLGIAAVGVFTLWRGSAEWFARLSLLAWAALLGLAYAIGDPFAVPLAVGAYFALLASLSTHIQRLGRLTDRDR
jgi:hypothetical protein